MRKIQLTKGQVALVDDENYTYLNKFKWLCSSKGYARRTIYPSRKTIHMHRLIIKAPIDMEVDHINHNTLDNRKINLRICTRIQQMQNIRKRKHTSSKFKGVTWDKESNKWLSQIRINKILKKLGRFEDEICAHLAYVRATKKFFGRFACLK